jgi:hypothetical protein
VNDTLAEIGAAIKSIPSLAGAVLQLAQQTLSLRYGKKPSLEYARMIKTQCVVEVIWEGRNHAMHWDDKKPKAPVMGMLATLSMDYQLSLEPGRNHSLAILKAMGWVNPASVANELFTLVAGCA